MNRKSNHKVWLAIWVVVLALASPVWNCATVRGEVTPLDPADGAGIPGEPYPDPPALPTHIWTMLIFNPGTTAVKHTAYFSEDYSEVYNRVEDANLGSPPYPYPGWDNIYFAGNPEVEPAVDSLVRGTTYYWTVDETDGNNVVWQGPVWSFYVQSYYATRPNPPNEAININHNVLLSWQPGYKSESEGTLAHDIYIGTSWDEVNNADHWDTTGIYQGWTFEPSWPCSNLAFNTTYYWRVDEEHYKSWPFEGPIYKGDVWCFTTMPHWIFVDVDADGANDGTSWADAYNYLQDALADANSSEKPVEIWVAEGIYTPDSNSADPNGSDDRGATFQLINGVAIYGGFPAGGGAWEERDPNDPDSKTILSGDLYGDDGPDFANNGENSYHVVTGYQTDSMDETTDVLDGFIVTGGNANGSSYPNNRGGGMYCRSDATITNCTFIGNSADWGGGGMFCGPTWCCVTYPTVTNCTFIGNSAGEEGGGMRVGDSDPKLTNCKIIGNSAGSSGGGVMFGGDNFTSMVNCLINGNLADWGGGIYGVFCFQWTMTNCTVSGNSAAERGGGMFNEYDCHMTLTNCVLWMNQDSGGLDESAQVDYEPGEAPVVNYSCIQGWTGALGGIGNINEDPRFAQLGFWDVNGVWIDGDYHLLADSSCIDAGNDSAPNLPLTDLDGHPRIIDGDCNDTDVVDMGAYEFNYAYMGDFDYDCSVDFVDFSIFGLAWMTKPGDAQWNRFCDISKPYDNYIDWRDAAIVCDHWLAEIP